MNNQEKEIQLRKYKRLATGLFLLMAVIYGLSIWYGKHSADAWIGYVSAFSEAGMVGALADWFAVTALFHHPLGLKIPHTNLIENSKQRIGDNLGNFVSENFLNSKTIRPYIEKMQFSSWIGSFLSSQKNIDNITNEIRFLLGDILNKLKDEEISKIISQKAKSIIGDLPLKQISSDLIRYLIDNGEVGKLTTALAGKLKIYIKENADMVKDRVSKESYFFIPKFVDNKLADKITNGLYNYFEEIEQNPDHPLHNEVLNQIELFSTSLQTEEKWDAKFVEWGNLLANGANLEKYISNVWKYLKENLKKDIESKDGLVQKYLNQFLQDTSKQLNQDEVLQNKIDSWIRHNLYRLILKNNSTVSNLISNTVGNWQGRELSKKLELEVGKDLQFIRINGTLVGGLMGLLIHTVTRFFG